MIVVVLHPPTLHLRVFVVDDDVGDGILRQLEHRRVDQRVGQEVVPAVPEELLDRRRQVRVRDVEERTRVVHSLRKRTLRPAPSLREPCVTERTARGSAEAEAHRTTP